MIYGAIIGDIVGSRFEFDRGPWTKDFEFFTPECTFTDDTIMTVAIAEALHIVGAGATIDEIKARCIERMTDWGLHYPNAGYGAMFAHWINNPVPYNSFGNGSAMRVSAVAWMYDNLERVREVARATAEISHNHPEGIKGADAIATAIWMALHGFGKNNIRQSITEIFGYDLTTSVAEYSANHRHDETCMDTVPKALVAFLESASFEDTIRNAICIGGDTDTIAAIAGSIAEAYYEIPEDFKAKCDGYLTDDILRRVRFFEAGK